MQRSTIPRRFIGLLAVAGLLPLAVGSCLAGAAADRLSPVGSKRRAVILFGGDTSFGESYGRATRQVLESRGYAYPLSGLAPLAKASDLLILNLETPVCELDHSPLAQSKTYVHWTDVRRAPAELVRHGVGLVSLANNHAMDYGVEGLAQTLEILKQHGIGSVGAGMTQEQAEEPYVIDLRVRGGTRLVVIGAFEYLSAYDRRYDFYAKDERGGTARLSVERIIARIERLKTEAPETFVVVFPHWGPNYGWRTERQALAARRLVDGGADLILGHGAHRLQEVERYAGRFIVYGLGNYMFLSQGRFGKLDSPPFGLVAQLVFEKRKGGLKRSLKLYPVHSDNLTNGYRPRLVDAAELEQVWDTLRQRADDPEQLGRFVTIGRDRVGHFLSFSLD